MNIFEIYFQAILPPVPLTIVVSISLGLLSVADSIAMPVISKLIILEISFTLIGFSFLVVTQLVGNAFGPIAFVLILVVSASETALLLGLYIAMARANFR